VSEEDARAYADQEDLRFIETSALEATNVEEAFLNTLEVWHVDMCICVGSAKDTHLKVYGGYELVATILHPIGRGCTRFSFWLIDHIP
jgi:hypothetical protein